MFIRTSSICFLLFLGANLIIQSAMDSNNALKDFFNQDYKTKTQYVREDPLIIKARTEFANQCIKDGMTFKHAWWSAFQQYPRIKVEDH